MKDSTERVGQTGNGPAAGQGDDPALTPATERAEAETGEETGKAPGAESLCAEPGAAEKEGVSRKNEDAERLATDLALKTAELTSLNEKYLRLYAEFENYKRRTQKDKEEIQRFANECLILDLLTVVDHLEMALRHRQGESLEPVVQGVELTLREFENVLEKNGTKPIPARGEEFDPTLHHAMAQIASTDVPEGHVAEEFRKGYTLNGKVIRPSMVAVAKASSQEEPHAGQA